MISNEVSPLVVTFIACMVFMLIGYAKYVPVFEIKSLVFWFILKINLLNINIAIILFVVNPKNELEIKYV